MTKSEIEKLIEYIDLNIPKRGLDERYHNGKELVDTGVQIYCKVNDVYDFLRDYPVEPEKTCDKPMVTLFLDGDVTPLNLAKAFLETRLMSVREIMEMVAYLKVYVDHHLGGGVLK